MKKSLVLVSIFAMAMAFSTIAKAADSSEFHMNSRFWYTDNASQPEGRWSLHCVEFSAATEVDNIGGSLIYRLADQDNGVTANAYSAKSFPVEAKAYIKFGEKANHKITAGLQFVPFAIYKWNNLYHPFLDKPGANGLIWDADWGMLYTYDAKPVLLDIGYFDNAGELLGARESAEKNNITIRLGYDIFSNWNLGASYMKGDMDMDGDDKAMTDRALIGIDTTWKPLSNLQLQAEYIDVDFGEEELGAGSDVQGDLGLVQLKYDIVKVPAPLNKISFVLQYSWEDFSAAGVSMGKEKNYQEEIWLQAGKNMNIFWQNVQEKVPGVDTAKYHYLAFKYNLF